MNNNQKATKRALLTSVMALVMCVVMLVGTTFAWFTDTASTAVNKIVAGNLDVDIVDKNGDSLDGKTLSFVNKDNSAQILWEPGVTFHTEGFRIKNAGNLALKWKVEINKDRVTNSVVGSEVTPSKSLLEVIDFSIVDASGNTVDIDNFTGHIRPADGSDANTGFSGVYKIKAHMDANAGNDYQNLTLDGITITVYATQDTVEFDSFDDQYDKDAPIVYPAGVTTDSFPGSVSYPTYNGRTETAEAVAAYVDSNGTTKYAADIANAIKDGATTIYLKKDADVKAAIWGTNRTPDLTSDLTIYANGADFQYGEIALNSTTTAAKDITVKVYDAKNLYIWGYSPAGDKALTVLMENCHNVGASATEDKGRMFYISNNSTRGNGTINVTLRNCSVEKSDSPVYMNADGSMILENCTFIECAVPVNNNYKSNGTRTDVVKNCTFIGCGCTAGMNSGISEYAAPIRFVKSGNGTLSVTLKDNTFTGTIGTNGDIPLGDYRNGKTSNPFDAEIVTNHAVMVKSSAGAAFSCSGGTINVG